MRRDKVYDDELNKPAHLFHKVYVITAVIFCIALVGVLLITVSYLPPSGNANNPVNNVVSERYIEEGLQETGALNIVAGMILTYRAFELFDIYYDWVSDLVPYLEEVCYSCCR